MLTYTHTLRQKMRLHFFGKIGAAAAEYLKTVGVHPRGLLQQWDWSNWIPQSS